MSGKFDILFLSQFLPVLANIDPYNISEDYITWMSNIKTFLRSKKGRGDEILVDKLQKLWVDDVRSMPEDYNVHLQSTNEVINFLAFFEDDDDKRFLLDLDHDAGDFRNKGGDYIKILDWIEATDYLINHPHKIIFSIHSANPVGRENMMRIINKNDWEYI